MDKLNPEIIEIKKTWHLVRDFVGHWHWSDFRPGHWQRQNPQQASLTGGIPTMTTVDCQHLCNSPTSKVSLPSDQADWDYVHGSQAAVQGGEAQEDQPGTGLAVVSGLLPPRPHSFPVVSGGVVPWYRGGLGISSTLSQTLPRPTLVPTCPTVRTAKTGYTSLI